MRSLIRKWLNIDSDINGLHSLITDLYRRIELEKKQNKIILQQILSGRISQNYLDPKVRAESDRIAEEQIKRLREEHQARLHTTGEGE